MKPKDQLIKEIEKLKGIIRNNRGPYPRYLEGHSKTDIARQISYEDGIDEGLSQAISTINKFLKGYKLVKNDRIEWLKQEISKEIEFAKSNPHKVGRSFNQIIDEAFEDVKTTKEKGL